MDWLIGLDRSMTPCRSERWRAQGEIGACRTDLRALGRAGCRSLFWRPWGQSVSTILQSKRDQIFRAERMGPPRPAWTRTALFSPVMPIGSGTVFEDPFHCPIRMS